ncbi:hypothetical protein [Corynebacterium glucuronolyticum]|uniref:hypothetical protein n=1 Tax=Corynebacterium glucuronolyticum TaxID=39791 RepID=UPI0009D795E3|nr:hypothetical protein [Corynebacterium glucuronolyticum]QRO82779.1 hypothetical protein I6J20_00930 [Corynebacterium glucuronolyticum]
MKKFVPYIFTGILTTGMLTVPPSSAQTALPENLDSRDGTDYSIGIVDTDSALRTRAVGDETTVDSGAGKKLVYTIESAQSPHEKTFDFGLPENARIVEEDGFFYVAFDGVKKIRFSVPWAKDANGNELPTWFTTDGKRLTQHVEFDSESAFPISADPRMNWGIISGHVYFDKEETRRMAASGSIAAAITPFWLAVPQPFGLRIAYWWGANSVAVTSWATTAHHMGKCLALKIGVTGGGLPPSIGVEPEHYTEGCN